MKTPTKWQVCFRCKQELKPHERTEGFCDVCCRLHTPPHTVTGEPASYTGDLERLEIPRYPKGTVG